MAGGKVTESLVVGPNVDRCRGLLTLTRPMSRGVIEDAPMTEAILHYVYSSLHASSEDHPLLITEPVHSSYKSREVLAEMIYETFRAPALHLSTPGVLALFASAQSTGLVVDVGDGVASCTPVAEGFAVAHATTRMDVAGRDVTDRLEALLKRGGAALASSAEREVVREIKEKVCYVRECVPNEDEIAAMYRGDRTDPNSPWGIYKLPDNSIMDVTQSTSLFLFL